MRIIAFSYQSYFEWNELPNPGDAIVTPEGMHYCVQKNFAVFYFVRLNQYGKKMISIFNGEILW